MVSHEIDDTIKLTAHEYIPKKKFRCSDLKPESPFSAVGVADCLELMKEIL